MEPKQDVSKRNATMGAVLGVIVMGLAYFGVQELFFKTPSFDKAMMEAANQLNASCPIMIDQDTRLDNTAAMPGKVFNYYYTLVNVEHAATNADTLRKYIEPMIVNGVKKNPDMKAYRDNQVTMGYYYRDKNGVFILKIEVTPGMYAE